MIKIVSGLFLILLLTATGFAQKQKTDSDSNRDAQSVRRSGDKSAARSNDVVLRSGASIEAQLQQTLDVRNASVGDRVVLTTTKAIKQNGRTIVEKGSRLIGRVTEVQQKTKNNAQSKLGVVFERLEGKNLSAPISATIVSIVEANAEANVSDAIDADMTSRSTTSGSASRSNSGGGLLGGVTNTVGGVVNTTTSAVGGVTGTAGQTLDGTTGSLGKTLNGIRLTQSAEASVSGTTTLSAQDKNLRLEKGVTFQLRLSQSIEN